MPTYVYRREDGSTFEVEQKITDDKLETCPDTGQPVERLISGGSFHLKGSGFYETDYVRNKDTSDPKTSNGSTESSNASGNSSSADSTSSGNSSSSDSETSTAKSTTAGSDS